MKNNILIKRILYILFFFIYITYSVGLFMRVGINSDYANLVLEASDILSGNPFLAGWNLTGISFYSTDMIFFVIGTLIFGKSVYAYYAAVVMMYALLFGGAMLLISEKNNLKPVDLLILLAAGGFPSIYACDVLRAHTAVPAYFFFALICLMKILKSDKIKPVIIYAVIYTILLAMGVCGDSEMLVIGIVPILFITAYKYLMNRLEKPKTQILVFVLTVAAAVIGKLADIIIMSIGSTNKNTFLDGKTFMGFDSMKEKLRVYLYSIMGMTDSYFMDKQLLSVNTLWYFLRILIVLLTFFIIIKNIVLFLRGKKCDDVNVILSIGFSLISVLFIITDIAADVFSARYIGYFPILSGILLVRDFKTYERYSESFFNKKVRFSFIAFWLSLIVCVSRLQPVSFVPAEQPQDRLAVFLEKNNLNYGYAKFWNASHVTISSNDTVKVRAVIYDGNMHLAQFLWFCKNDWYLPEKANFVVIEKGDENGDIFGITEASVKKSVGTPSKILKFEKYLIYVYKNDISSKIVYLGGK